MILPRFRSEDVLDLAKSHGFTVLNLTPAMIYDLAYHPDDRSLSAVRMVCVGTDRLPLATRIRFEDRFGIPVLENYGQTEFGGAIALERYDDVLAGIRPPGSVGRIVPGAEVVIVDRSGSPMAVGDVGEIWARGSSAMSGYLRDSASAPDGARDGWIATGDLGSLDENQILTVHGRLRDVVICGGFNVYPAMVESALNAVAGVIDSAVVGLQDDRLGEVPIAAIVLAPGHMTNVDEVHSQLRSALAPYEVPRLIVATAAIPRTGNGKVDRPAVLRLCVEA
jgi:fatty-acyl-CoA synthase/O-succinylbenzoic acid--CoA ligase